MFGFINFTFTIENCLDFFINGLYFFSIYIFLIFFEKMPKEFLRLTNIMISNSQEEQNTLELAIAKKQKSIATIQANLSKKMGPEYKDKQNCLTKLCQKQTQIEAQIALLQEERIPLIEEFKAQYAKQEIQQKTVEQLVDEMVGVVLEKEN